MDQATMSLLTITPLYAALLGLFFVPITARVGFYRVKTEIFIGDGGDPRMLQLMRGQANFVETAPFALLLIVLMELSGASSTWLHGLAGLLLFGRVAHYLGLTKMGPEILRGLGMGATILTYVLSSGWLLYSAL
jgi:uncharacterized membrane protein YecN with MAPEG domain